jgi:hypothetical protein
MLAERVGSGDEQGEFEGTAHCWESPAFDIDGCGLEFSIG